jgi:hypothetical protein
MINDASHLSLQRTAASEGASLCQTYHGTKPIAPRGWREPLQSAVQAANPAPQSGRPSCSKRSSSPATAWRSFGIMVNYLYDHDSIENNHEAFVRGGTIVRSSDVDALMQRPA